MDDDSSGVARIKQAIGKDFPCSLVFADTAEAFRQQLQDNSVTIAVLGDQLDNTQRQEALQHLKHHDPDIPWIDVVVPEDCGHLLERLRARPQRVVPADDTEYLAGSIRTAIKNRIARERFEQQKQQIHEIESRYNLLLDSSTEAIAYVHAGLHVYANQAYLELLGYADRDALAAVSLLEVLEPADGNHDIKPTLRRIDSGETTEHRFEVRLQPFDGEPCKAEASFFRARFNGENCTQVMLRPITGEHALTEDHLEKLRAYEQHLRAHDPLTGLLQRNALLERAQPLLEKNHEQHAIGMLVVNIDNFHKVQDSLGLVLADEVLAERARLLRNCLDEERDLLGRNGEHAFAAVVQRGQRSALEQLAEHIVTTVASEVVNVSDASVSVTCSVGLSFAGRQNHNAETILSQAVRAGRDAQERGGNSFVRFRPKLRAVDETEQKAHAQERLRHAMDNDELSIRGQPIANVEDDNERLVELHVELPATESEPGMQRHEMLEAVELTPLAAELDRHVVRSMLRAMRKQPGRWLLPLAPRNHDPKAFADWLKAGLKSEEIPGDQIILLLDSRLMETNMQPAEALFKALHGSHISWALDAYGATENAEQQILHLKPEFARLADELIPTSREMTQQAPLSKLLQAANKASTRLIVRNVNQAQALPPLWQAGINLIQGEFVSRRSFRVG